MKVGRDAVYSESHAERLELIGELRTNGLTLQTIRQLVEADGLTQSVSDWLGVDATLSAPWSDDRPRTFNDDELSQRLTRFGLDKPGVLADLRRAGFISSAANDMWDVPSPTLRCSATHCSYSQQALSSTSPAVCAICCTADLPRPSKTQCG